MNRAFYLLGWGYVVIAATLVMRTTRPDIYHPLGSEASMPAFLGASPAARWFLAMKPRCNALEAGLAIQSNPAPAGWEGAGFAAACWALAGRIDRARVVIESLPAGERVNAAGIVFNVGHPIADAGDDRSAGPIMQLVVEFQPYNYMALYHAGMSYYAIDEPALAQKYLEEFLRHYGVEDGWQSNAKEILRRLGRSARS